MLDSTSSYFEQKKQFIIDNVFDPLRSKYCFYELDDGKMLYLLTQHSSWSRKHHPRLLCSYKRVEGVLNNDHVCNFISNEGHFDLYEKSEDEFKRNKVLANGLGMMYSKADHMKWNDSNNKGCSHFGLHPSLFPRDSIRFDTLYLKYSITRRLMSNLRDFLINQAPEMMENKFLHVYKL